MQDSTLLIPDISGFTKFVRSTEVEHSKHIIEELIDLIITVGTRKFDLVEIEGDAVFFFKNKKYSKEEVEEVANSIYVAFHEHLGNYEHNRICQCGACTTALNLKIKFIVHSGEVTLANFKKGKPKPFGDPVIAVHRLLKNDVPSNEYVLFSDSFLEKDLELDGAGTKNDDDLGAIKYQYRLTIGWSN